jgi:hypothetical protein
MGHIMVRPVYRNFGPLPGVYSAMKYWQGPWLAFRLMLLAILCWLTLGGLPTMVAWRERTFGPRPVKPHYAPYDWVDRTKGLRIIQFYPSRVVIREGEKALICYGVMNAKAVRIEPPVADLSPSFSRVIEVQPRRTTRYTLVATDAQGQEARQDFQIEVR